MFFSYLDCSYLVKNKKYALLIGQSEYIIFHTDDNACSSLKTEVEVLENSEFEKCNKILNDDSCPVNSFILSVGLRGY